MKSTVLRLRTGSVPTIHDLTGDCARFVDAEGDGLLNVWVPHATAGVAVFELGAGSDEDLLRVLDDLLPRDYGWRHRHGTPGHGRDHVLPAFVAPSVVVPVLGGRLALGTWQSVVLVDPNGDNPERTVRLSLLT